MTIGFNPDNYIVNEADGQVTLFVEVLNGTLQRPVTVLFTTNEGTATPTGTVDGRMGYQMHMYSKTT